MKYFLCLSLLVLHSCQADIEVPDEMLALSLSSGHFYSDLKQVNISLANNSAKTIYFEKDWPYEVPLLKKWNWLSRSWDTYSLGPDPTPCAFIVRDDGGLPPGETKNIQMRSYLWYYDKGIKRSVKIDDKNGIFKLELPYSADDLISPLPSNQIWEAESRTFIIF